MAHLILRTLIPNSHTVTLMVSKLAPYRYNARLSSKSRQHANSLFGSVSIPVPLLCIPQRRRVAWEPN